MKFCDKATFFPYNYRYIKFIDLIITNKNIINKYCKVSIKIG